MKMIIFFLNKEMKMIIFTRFHTQSYPYLSSFLWTCTLSWYFNGKFSQVSYVF